MNDYSTNLYFLHTLVFLSARYVHIVCATVLVGGTLFYEMVVPPAIDELKMEQQLLIFARARLFFKWIVWLSAALILISGVVSTYSHWNAYTQEQVFRIDKNGTPSPVIIPISPLVRPGWWWAAHGSCGLLAVLIAVSLTFGKSPPTQPIRWMRLNLVILFLVMFMATVARQTRLEQQRPAPPPGALEPSEILPQ
jgi:hypothetical protein